MLIPISIMASGGSIIDIDSTFFIQLVIFVVMFLVLRQLLFRPVIRIIEARREETEGKRMAAEEFDEETRKLNKDVEKKISEIKSSASTERAKLVEQSRHQERDLLAKAREDSRSVVEQTKKETSEQTEKVWQTLREEINSFASTAATKVLGRQI